MLKFVLDTNIILSSVSPFSPYRLVIDKFENFTYDLADNKFLDCAFAANAHYLVTNDKDYKILKTPPFPKVHLLK